MGLLFKIKKRLLTKAALAKEKKKLIKEAQAKIESNELSQLTALRNRISKAKNINIPKNLESEIKRRKAAKRMLLKSAGKNLKVGARSLVKIGKELNKLANAKSAKTSVKRKIKRKVTKRKITKRRKR